MAESETMLDLGLNFLPIFDTESLNVPVHVYVPCTWPRKWTRGTDAVTDRDTDMGTDMDGHGYS
jgi:hypothetical protein